jgi:hypothetical protein
LLSSFSAAASFGLQEVVQFWNRREDNAMKKDTEKGTIRYEDGKYFVEANDRREALPTDLLTSAEDLKPLVGQEVEVLYSEPRRFIIGLVPHEAVKWPRIICYVPAPWRGMIEARAIEAMRLSLAKQYHDEGIISEEVFKKLT